MRIFKESCQIELDAVHNGDIAAFIWQNGSSACIDHSSEILMLSRNLGSGDSQAASWQDLGFGAPTILGFANLCSRAMTIAPDSISADDLSPEAKTILAVAADRGTLDIRASREPFDSAERFLAVCVEHSLDQRLLFRQKENPKQTVRFLEGFRQLCKAGLIIHHLQKDFSLSAAGFEVAQILDRAEFESLISFAVEIEH